MSPRYDEEWVARLLDAEDRLGTTDPREFLAASGLSERQAVVDFGCGPGFFTLPAATIVGPLGRVYAVDVEQKMLDLVGRTATSNGHQNVHTVLSTGQGVPLADGIADFAICVLVLHYPEDLAGRVGIAREIARLVRPAGALLIVNWTPQEGDDNGSRLSSEQMAAILRGAGFEPDAPRPRGESQYAMTARRIPSRSTPG